MSGQIILANGKPPSKQVVNYLMTNGYSEIICADGGADKARSLKIIPSAIIGDLDSISAKTLKYYTGKTKIIKIKRQTDTDVEKCLKFLIQKKIKDVILLGVTGNRLDHTFCNLGIVIKYFDKIKIRIIAENSLLTALTGRVVFKTVPGETISLFGLHPKTKISTKGLKYSLTNENLPFGIRESTSNVALENEVTLNIKHGIIFIIREFNVMKKYGLFK